MNNTTLLRIGIVGALLAVLGLRSASVESDTVYFAGTPANVAQVPLYIKDSVPPLNMLVMGKDHKIYYEAYNDAGDLDGDGIPDVGYKPAQIDYYGYFNSHACYVWNTDKFVPSSYTANKQCAEKWSGDFLNYVTTSRMDALRRVLYGGWRQVDTNNETVLQGAFVPQDAHSWGKEYKDSVRDGYDIGKYTPLGAPDAGKYHLFAVTTLSDNTAPLMRVLQNTPSRVWNWLSIEGPVAGNKCFNTSNQRIDCIASGNAAGSPRRDDYQVRVQVCPDDANLRNGDSSCKQYPSKAYKPTGILHEYGEPRKMYFGLISGSQQNNLEGGVLRRNISDFNDEIIPGTGVFKKNIAGIANTISSFRMIGGGYNDGTTNNSGSDSNWNWANTTNGSTGNCPSIGDRSINNGECRMWGNPIGEMLYESMRYFSGAEQTARFATGGSTDGASEETKMGIEKETWKDPYKATGGADGGLGFPTCAAPVQTIISDINPSYDGDLPGSAFNNVAAGSGTPMQIQGFNAKSEGDAMWTAEGLGTRSVFIGEVQGASTDGAPTAKTASSLGNIRGLSPEEPTKGGTYYSASVARFGFNNDINAAKGAQNITTYSIALASPLPKVELPNGITILPFGKTASGTFGNGGQANKPTNTIVDFYVQQYENFPGQTRTGTNGGLPYAVFRINYEDVEQGNDHDMDAIVLYEIKGKSDGSVDVILTSEYAAGSADQNIGYVISGSNKDGIYLVVRDTDSGAGTFRPYDLNTPPGIDPGGCTGVTTGVCNQQLPLASNRTFSAGNNTAIRLKDPLWFAAKYGNPSTATGIPANYFLVTNPLNLRDQLRQAFDNIADAPVDIGNTSISGARVGNSSFTLLPSYAARRNRKDWTGNLTATAVNADGTLGAALWEAQASLPLAASRKIFTITEAGDGTNAGTGIKARDFQTGNLSFSTLGFTGNVKDVYGTDYPLDDMVNYLRGDQSHEASKATTGSTLRTRSAVLGDIVNSEPVIASPKSNFGYGYYTDAMFTGYSTVGGYLTDKASRKTVAYVGANDGMLHAFDASTQPCADDDARTCAKPGAGKELFAFVPNGVLDGMGELPKPDSRFAHRYFVDGQITVTDAKDGNDWKTLLVGSAGAGGRSVFVLDVGNPDGFNEGSVLWERNAKVDLDIGNVYGKPILVPLENDKWGVLFGNGYGGNLSDPSLYILDAFTGKKIAKITANDDNPGQTSFIDGLICAVADFLPNFPGCARETDPYNGLGQITSIDKDGNGKVDTVYGGDLQGNLWKFDLSDKIDADNWKVANGTKPLFQTQLSTNASGQQQYQPITGGIRVAAGPGTGAMIYFGTGRYFVTGDNEVAKSPQVPQLQSLYAFFDNGGTTADPLTVASLQRQTVTVETEAGAYSTRDISTEPVFYYGADAKRGWYLDLKVVGSPNNDGERFIATPLVQSGRVFFTTYTPKEDSCNPGGTNFQYGLDLLSGTGSLGNVQLLGTGSVACENSDCGAAAIVTQGGSATQAPVMGVGVAAINPLVQIDPACNPAVESCAGFTQCQVVIYPGAFVLPRPCGRQSWRQLK